MRRLVNEVCQICRKQMKSFFEVNSAYPVSEGKCCIYCNHTVVVPARVKHLRQVNADQ